MGFVVVAVGGGAVNVVGGANTGAEAAGVELTRDIAAAAAAERVVGTLFGCVVEEGATDEGTVGCLAVVSCGALIRIGASNVCVPWIINKEDMVSVFV